MFIERVGRKYGHAAEFLLEEREEAWGDYIVVMDRIVSKLSKQCIGYSNDSVFGESRRCGTIVTKCRYWADVSERDIRTAHRFFIEGLDFELEYHPARFGEGTEGVDCIGGGPSYYVTWPGPKLADARIEVKEKKVGK